MTSSRRAFLQGATAAAVGAAALPSCSTRPAPRPAKAPSEKLKLIVVGVSGRGGDNLNGVAGEDIAVLCDVDGRALAKAGERFPAARRIADFREVLADAAACRALDGAVVSTPDHTHYPAAMLALQHGLDVYCEKPLTHTVAQARRLATLARQNGCITQMGIQIHANAPYRRTVEAVRAGAVGPVREVFVFVNGTDWSAQELPAGKPVPEWLQWDCWLGPAAERGYSDGYHPAAWRRYWAFGGGTTADMACHYMDLAFWALDLDAPTSLVADGPEPHAECAPRGMRCVYDFPARGARAPVVVHWHAGNDRPAQVLAERGLDKWTNGVLFVGDDGWLIANYDKHEIGPTPRAAAWQAPPQTIAPSPGHHAEWIWCCKERIVPTCSFAYAAPLTETVLLANVAFRAARGRRLRWDAAALELDDAAANRLLDETPRAGFSA
ncbi:MAG: Gfo/Idh/MocA family oxidoreductase [Planctomycetota bacterium]